MENSNLNKQSEGSLRPFLELVRPPALLTASADSLAGWAWVMSVLRFAQQSNETTVLDSMASDQVYWSLSISAVILMLASTMIYAAGMATNDLFDYEEDLQDRPFRPLPSKRISLKKAWGFALGLQVASLIILFFGLDYVWGKGSTWSLFFAVLTILMTYLYNKVFKQRKIAPVFMGLCRWGNFWIGGSLAVALIYPNITISDFSNFSLPLYSSLGTLSYVTALTALSRYETKGGASAKLWAYFLVIISTHPLWWHAAGYSLVSDLFIQDTLLYPATLLCTLWLYNKIKPLLKGDTSEVQVQRAVGAGIRGVALSNICLCISFGSWSLALLLLSLAFSAGKVARWFYAT